MYIYISIRECFERRVGGGGGKGEERKEGRKNEERNREVANSSAICVPAGNSGKEEISACRIPWIRVYIYVALHFIFRDMNNDPHRSGEKWRYRGGIFGNGGGKMMERRCFWKFSPGIGRGRQFSGRDV